MECGAPRADENAYLHDLSFARFPLSSNTAGSRSRILGKMTTEGDFMTDDRDEFVSERRRNSILIGKDNRLRQSSRDIIVDADRYKYSYLWTWLGVPIIQLPSDIIATQEIIWREQPEVIVETGVARGGSVIMYASLLSLLGRGKVIGVDIDIRAHNRDTIENHVMAPWITLVDGSSIASETVSAVRELIPSDAKTMVVLDSNHSHEHVLSELEAYAPIVTPGQYLIVADTLLGELSSEQTPTARADVWHPGNEPLSALKQYLSSHPEFEQDEEINGKMILSSSPGGYVKRLR
jgi:cephalosporin hydroxylase